MTPLRNFARRRSFLKSLWRAWLAACCAHGELMLGAHPA